MGRTLPHRGIYRFFIGDDGGGGEETSVTAGSTRSSVVRCGWPAADTCWTAAAASISNSFIARSCSAVSSYDQFI